MNRNTITIHTIDVDRFNRQRGLIAKMVSDLNRGESAFVVKSDAPELSGILAILDEINDQNDLDGVDKRANESPCTDMGTTLECPDCDNSGPDCPGCGTPGGCDTCEYTKG